MTVTPPPISREVVLINEFGLHARSAARIARLAKNARAGIWVSLGAEKADATSVLELLGIACEKGTTLTLGVDDPWDTPVLEELVRLVESGFGE
jgi:phosphocarrier protein